jgi:orotate phosphoribosyltransferase
MNAAARTQLLELLRQRAVIHGNITLASGQSSTYYIDCRMVLLNSVAATLIGEVLYAMTEDLHLDAIGGPEVGAIPMASAAVIRYQQAGRTMEGYFVRKATKQHGTGKLIEGMFRPGYRVAVVEDVMTTGTSSVKAIEVVRQAGGQIEAVICLVDRLQGARERIEALGLRFWPVFTLDDLLGASS